MSEIVWKVVKLEHDETCLVCKQKIQLNTEAEWKKNVGFRHIKCAQNFSQLIQLKDKALQYYRFKQYDKADQIYSQINKLEESMNIRKPLTEYIDSDKLQNNEKSKQDSINTLIDSISKDNILKEKAKTSFSQFNKIFKQKFLELSRNMYDPLIYEKITESSQIHELSRRFYDIWRERNAINLDGETPYSDRKEFVRIIHNCNEFIHYADKYFHIGALEFFIISLELEYSNLNEIKILTSGYSLGTKLNQKFKEIFEKLQKELKEYGVDCQLKVIISKTLDNQIHNRYLFTKDTYYDIPSRDYSLFGSTCSISKLNDAIKPLKFENWWNHPDALDIITEWETISKKINPSCSKCGKTVFSVPSKIIKSGKPILCKACIHK